MTIPVILIVVIVAIDQLTKYAVRHWMSVGQSFDVIKGFFAITYCRNDGAAFSSFGGQKIFLIVVSVIAVVFAFTMLVRKRGTDRLCSSAMVLICAGGIGNLIDRLVFGEVTDMFAFSIFPPVFNVADIAVVIGCALAVIWAFVDEKKQRAARAAEPETVTPSAAGAPELEETVGAGSGATEPEGGEADDRV